LLHPDVDPDHVLGPVGNWIDLRHRESHSVFLASSLGLTAAEPHLVRRIREEIPAVRTVMVGVEPEEENFCKLFAREATGYVLRDASAAEVLSAIRAVAAGEAVSPRRFSAALFRCAARQLAIR